MLRMRLKKLYVRVFGCPKKNTSIVYKKIKILLRDEFCRIGIIRKFKLFLGEMS